MKRTIAGVGRVGAGALHFHLIGIASLALASWTAAEERPPEFRVIEIPTLGGGAPSVEVDGLNAAGEATGQSDTPDGLSIHAYRFRRGMTKDIGTLGDDASDYSIARAINDAGQIVGVASVRDAARNQNNHAFLYSNGLMEDLGTLGGNNSEAWAINSRGQAAGGANLPAGEVDHAFIYSDGQMTDLGTLGGRNSNARGINSHGAVVGSSDLLNTQTFHAFIYIDGSMRDLGSLGAGLSSAAFGVNCAGQVTGFAFAAADGEPHAFFYAHGRMKDLGTLPGDNYSIGYSVNSEGEIVGLSTFDPGPPQTGHAFLYVDGKMFDLMTLIDPSDPLLPHSLYGAVAINDDGVIAANGTDALGKHVAYLLEPRRPHGEVERGDKSHPHECFGDREEDRRDKAEEHKDRR